MTEPPPEPDTECGACYKDWEEAVAKFQPQRVLACTTCQTDADCGGTACARASGFGDAAIKVCTSYQCAGVWRARGADATCEPMRM